MSSSFGNDQTICFYIDIVCIDDANYFWNWSKAIQLLVMIEEGSGVDGRATPTTSLLVRGSRGEKPLFGETRWPQYTNTESKEKRKISPVKSAVLKASFVAKREIFAFNWELNACIYAYTRRRGTFSKFGILDGRWFVNKGSIKKLTNHSTVVLLIIWIVKTKPCDSFDW